MAPTGPLVLACLALSGLLVVPMVTGQTTDGPTLWLRHAPPTFSDMNFTTVAPSPEDMDRQVEASTRVADSRIGWSSGLPAPLRIERGTLFPVVLYIAGLERVAPIADPTTQPDAIGSVRVAATFGSTDETVPPAATGAVDVPPGTSASGEVVEVRLDLRSPATVLIQPPWGVTLRVVVHGAIRQEEPLVFHLGSVAHPARIDVPGFPVSGHRAWETAELEEARCLERVLQDLPCTTPPDEKDKQARESAGITGAALVAVAMLALHRGRISVATDSPANSGSARTRIHRSARRPARTACR